MNKFIAATTTRKPLKRFVVFAYVGGYFIALKGFRSLWLAKRHARYLEDWGVTSVSLVVDSAEEGIIYEDQGFKPEDFKVTR